MKGDMDMKEKNRAEEWFRAKHDELAGTARANLAAHDLEPGQEAYPSGQPPLCDHRTDGGHMPDGHRL